MWLLFKDLIIENSLLTCLVNDTNFIYIQYCVEL